MGTPSSRIRELYKQIGALNQSYPPRELISMYLVEKDNDPSMKEINDVMKKIDNITNPLKFSKNDPESSKKYEEEKKRKKEERQEKIRQYENHIETIKDSVEYDLFLVKILQNELKKKIIELNPNKYPDDEAVVKEAINIAKNSKSDLTPYHFHTILITELKNKITELDPECDLQNIQGAVHEKAYFLLDIYSKLHKQKPNTPQQPNANKSTTITTAVADPAQQPNANKSTTITTAVADPVSNNLNTTQPTGTAILNSQQSTKQNIDTDKVNTDYTPMTEKFEEKNPIKPLQTLNTNTQNSKKNNILEKPPEVNSGFLTVFNKIFTKSWQSFKNFLKKILSSVNLIPDDLNKENSKPKENRMMKNQTEKTPINLTKTRQDKPLYNKNNEVKTSLEPTKNTLNSINSLKQGLVK
jgi:hypothetical protein